MAHILVRKYSSGATRYTANVRIRKGKEVVHRESKTFEHRSAAAKWAKSREVALEDPAALIRVKNGAPTLSELIRWYIDTFETISRWQRSKQTHLQFLEHHPIGASNALLLTPAIIIDHIRGRRAEGAGPATVANDLTWIGAVLRAAKSVKELPVNPDIVKEARDGCRELRLIAKSKKRSRRPTPEELARLDAFFAARDRRSQIPMRDILQFAIHSARREAEICRLEWADNETSSRSGLVRDAKHPTNKEGNHRRFKYTREAWDIVERQSRNSQYIFPYYPKSIGDVFTKACHVLGIVDLRFHDMRHEATSRLFERGYQIHEVAQFTLHDSWNELKRYTNLRPENVPDLEPNPSLLRNRRSPPSSPTTSNAVSQPSHVDGQSSPRGRRRSPAKATSAPRA
jgi:integrase